MLFRSSKVSLCALLIILSACAHFVYAQNSRPPFAGEITSNDINVRADSTPNAAVICTLNKGAKVEVVKEFFEWYKVRLPAKAPSYLKKRFVACLDQTAEGVCRSARVISNRVNVRLSPNETSAILGKVNKTDAVTILGEEKGWYRIEPVAGSFGWIHKKFIKVSEAPAEAGPIEEGKVGQ